MVSEMCDKCRENKERICVMFFEKKTEGRCPKVYLSTAKRVFTDGKIPNGCDFKRCGFMATRLSDNIVDFFLLENDKHSDKCLHEMRCGERCDTYSDLCGMAKRHVNGFDFSEYVPEIDDVHECPYFLEHFVCSSINDE